MERLGPSLLVKVGHDIVVTAPYSAALRVRNSSSGVKDSLIDESHVAILPDLASVVIVFTDPISLPVLDVICSYQFVRCGVLLEHRQESIAFTGRFAMHQLDED